MPLVLMKKICCGHCCKPTLHPLTTLRQICGHLPESAMETERIDYCCPLCSHLQHAWIPGESIQVDPQNLAEHREDTLPFLIAIECAERSCRSRVVVFAPMSIETSPSQAKDRVQDWVVDETVRCPEGHPPIVPCVIAGIKTISEDVQSR